VVLFQLLEAKFPERQRDHTFLTEVTEVIKLAAHQAVGAVWGDYWFHRAFIPEDQRYSLWLSTALLLRPLVLVCGQADSIAR